MRVIVMIKATRASEAGQPPSRRLREEMGRYNQALARAGIMLAGGGLQPSSRGVRVRFCGSQRTVSDGPFAQTRELLAGFWLWQVRSMDEAIEWVRRCPNPHPEETEVEIRPVFEGEACGEAPAPRERGDVLHVDLATRR